MNLNESTIRKYIPDNVAVRLYDTVDSTNNEAKRRAESGIVLYAAAHQTAGRGRRGHSFYSPMGTGLYMTVSLPLSDPLPASIQKITCAAGVAVCEAITELNGQKPRIKWVNDILIGGRKVAGILTELITDENNQPRAVIVGIGLNLCTYDFPDEFAERAGNLGEVDINSLCGTVAANLIAICGNLHDNSVIEKYKKLNLCLGHGISYEKDGIMHSAAAVDIDENGGLVVEENSIRSTLNSGEISIVGTGW